MVGYSTMMEVKLWVQTTKEAEVHIAYWVKGEEKQKFLTNKVKTEERKAFAVHLLADKVQPGNTYEYSLFINDKSVNVDHELSFQSQTLWQWRTDPPEFKFALGSCNYVIEPKYDRPGDPYGSDYHIFNSIHKSDPDFMLWLGDNIYLREADWNSKTGIYHRYTHNRSIPEVQPLLGSVHHYAIWDDHDFGPNDSDASYVNKKITEQAFKDFWANPNYGITGEGGITGSFQWADIEFFLLDNRYFRTANWNKVSEKELLGEKQIQWLINALSASRASFKFVVMGGAWLNDVPRFERYSTFPEEREKVLKLLKESGARGIVLLSGDIHHTELSKMEFEDHYPFYELTTSSLTAGISKNDSNDNQYLVPKTEVYEHNYAIMKVSGARKERILNIEIYNDQGNLMWEKSIEAKDLK